MSEKTKLGLLIAVVVAVVAVAVYSGVNSLGGPREEVVGELDMGPGGGRDAERGGSEITGTEAESTNE
jgi:hypothetical protein